jgi:hypothetical protein
MATTTAFGSLTVPPPDDTMEMSSPANRNLDDDIDIDFDDYTAAEDEQMFEDTTRPPTASDEPMDDEMRLTSGATPAHEELMQDDALHDNIVQEDDELIDYGEDEDLQEHTLDNTEIPNLPDEPTAFTEPAVEQFDEEIQRPEEIAKATAVAPTEEVIEVNQLAEQPVTFDDALGAEPAQDSHAEHFTATGDEEQHAGDYEETYPAEEGYDEQEPPAIDAAIQTPAEGPNTPTDTGLHPMTVRYGNLQIPLFKSRRQLDGLLKDDNLASLSLAELIKSCRHQLAKKTNEALSEDQEIVLGFDQLALVLVEVSSLFSD